MTYYYSDPERETDPHALPDIEVFYSGSDRSNPESGPAGWYWWPCFPGCLPDGDAIGPFTSELNALQDARGN